MLLAYTNDLVDELLYRRNSAVRRSRRGIHAVPSAEAASMRFVLAVAHLKGRGEYEQKVDPDVCADRGARHALHTSLRTVSDFGRHRRNGYRPQRCGYTQRPGNPEEPRHRRYPDFHDQPDWRLSFFAFEARPLHGHRKPVRLSEVRAGDRSGSGPDGDRRSAIGSRLEHADRRGPGGGAVDQYGTQHEHGVLPG